ncbi:hypothetical protein, partial [Methylorubrum populi]|uniref:hypothetical protein n=1 Tax=Methylorubrum populi TaxID=223967 RepID=UPI002355CE2B
ARRHPHSNSTSGRLTDGRSNSTPNFHLIDGHDRSTPMDAWTQPDEHDALWLFDEAVPSVAAVAEDVAVGSKDAVAEPVVVQEPP